MVETQIVEGDGPQAPALDIPSGSKTYRLSSKWLKFIYGFGILCCILVVTIPFGIMMFWLGKKAHITTTEEGVTIWYMGTRNIKWDEFEWLKQGVTSVSGLGIVGAVAGAALIKGPMIYKLKSQKRGGARIAVNMHENAAEIVRTFEARTGLSLGGKK